GVRGQRRAEQDAGVAERLGGADLPVPPVAVLGLVGAVGGDAQQRHPGGGGPRGGGVRVQGGAGGGVAHGDGAQPGGAASDVGGGVAEWQIVAGGGAAGGGVDLRQVALGGAVLGRDRGGVVGVAGGRGAADQDVGPAVQEFVVHVCAGGGRAPRAGGCHQGE